MPQFFTVTNFDELRGGTPGGVPHANHLPTDFVEPQMPTEKSMAAAQRILQIAAGGAPYVGQKPLTRVFGPAGESGGLTVQYGEQEFGIGNTGYSVTSRRPRHN